MLRLVITDVKHNTLKDKEINYIYKKSVNTTINSLFTLLTMTHYFAS